MLNLLGFFKNRRGESGPDFLSRCRSIDAASMSFKKAKSYQLVVAIAFLFCFGSQGLAEVVKGQISKIADATHIEFSGKTNWKYNLVKTAPNQYKLEIPALNEVTEANLKSWSDELIKDIKVNRNAQNGMYEIIFTTNKDNIESFDYLTDEPSRLIVDFFKTENPNKKVAKVKSAPKKVAKKKITKLPLKRKISSTDYQKVNNSKRGPAASEIITADQISDIENRLANRAGKPKRGVFDGGDPNYNRFKVRDYEVREEAIIASQQNIYIKFPMLKLKTSELEVLMNNPPEYSIKPKETEENKQARFLVHLYKKNRSAAFLKTYENFNNTFERSIYDEIVRNMAAEVYYKRWKEGGKDQDYRQFISTYEYLAKKYPKSALTERNKIIIGSAELERGNGIESIKLFQDFLKEHPESNKKDFAYKALTEGYMILSKYKEAMNSLNELEEKALSKENAIEASYRKGDVFFKDKKYKKAIEYYSKAIKDNPAYKGKFPNAYYNMAESQFWLGQYKKSLDNYVNYLEFFPDHEWGGYALTRVGELAGILGADQRKMIGAFLESYYRYRDSPGAEVARVRMLSQQMKGMKKKEMKKALEELKKISSESNLPRISEFVTLMVADGLHGRKEYEKAMNYLIGYYQRHPTSTDLEFFKKRILGNISNLILTKIEKKDFMEVLNINSKYSATWLRNSDRMDIVNFVANAYELAGVYDESYKMYKKILSQLESIEGTQEEKERRVNEYLPTIEETKLRLASVAIGGRKYQEAFSYLKTIKDRSKLDPESKVELVELSAVVAEQRGRVKEAKKYLKDLISNWQGKPSLLSSAYLKLAELQVKTKSYSQAEESLNEIERIKVSEEKMDENVWASALNLKGDVLVKQGKIVSAVDVYSKLLDEFEGKRPLGSVRYKAGKVLFKQGDLKGAEKIWKGLDKDKQAMYRKLADEKLENAKWQGEYKKYINRIPAATGL